MKKYEILLDDKIEWDGGYLYRIKALVNIDIHVLGISITGKHKVQRGEIGGYVQSENNLSQEGDCWIFDNAKVYDNACIKDNAQIFGNARIYGDAIVYENAKIGCCADVCDDVQVYGKADIYGNAQIYGNSKIYDNAIISDNANVCDNAKVHGHARVYYKAFIGGNSEVYGNVSINGNALINDTASIHGDAIIKGDSIIIKNAEVSGEVEIFNAVLSLDANIINNYSFVTVNGFGRKNRTTTFYLTKDNIVRINCGCFHGTIDEFEKEIECTHGDSDLGKEYMTLSQLMRQRFKRVLDNRK